MNREEKEKIVVALRERLDDGMLVLMNGIDCRLVTYYRGLVERPEVHNAYEMLGAAKWLRLLAQAQRPENSKFKIQNSKLESGERLVLDIETVQRVIYKYEGAWDGGKHHSHGGLRHPGTSGPTYYRLQPFQVFVLAAIFALKVWVDTGVEAGSRELLPSEEERGPLPTSPRGGEGQMPGDGKSHIWDLRRLCTEFTLYTPRKTAKTQLAGFIGFLFFMEFDENNEVLCCANASDQSKILFTRIRDLIHQLDPKEQRIRFTASQVNWKPGGFRSASVTALSAGGKTKDGLFAGLCLADEFGSAAYVNGASDMGKLVSVVESSMGPRREPLTFISTTAGVIQAGPFVDKLAAMKSMLEEEGGPTPTLPGDGVCPSDRQMCLLLEPDEWEMTDEEFLLTDKNVRQKVNPMLGVIVQHSFYDDEVARARQNPEKRNEVISKLFNVYQSATVQDWITPEQVRALQVERRIDDCKVDDGWEVYAAFDFSHGDDFDAVTFLAYNVDTGEYFADCDAWVNADSFDRSPFNPLYRKWREEGWLHVSGETVVEPGAPIRRVMELDEKGVSFVAFGYDAYQSKEPILLLKEWLFNTFGMDVKDINQIVRPVSQTFAHYNASVQKVEYCVDGTVPLKFSNSPLWPFEFGNCVLEEDKRMGNKKPLKRHPSGKVDNVQCLCSCFNLEEE